jgi:hypothetical protein
MERLALTKGGPRAGVHGHQGWSTGPRAGPPWSGLQGRSATSTRRPGQVSAGTPREQQPPTARRPAGLRPWSGPIALWVLSSPVSLRIGLRFSGLSASRAAHYSHRRTETLWPGLIRSSPGSARGLRDFPSLRSGPARSEPRHRMGSASPERRAESVSALYVCEAVLAFHHAIGFIALSVH